MCSTKILKQYSQRGIQEESGGGDDGDWTYVVESNQEEDKTRHCAAEEHHTDGEQQDVAQSKVNLLTVYTTSTYQLSLTNPRDALHRGKGAANKGGRSHVAQCDKLATKLS